MEALLALDLRTKVAPLFLEARAWAERLGARLSVMYVDPWLSASASVASPEVAQRLMLEAQAARGRDAEYLDQLLGTLPEAIRGRPLLVDGDPVEQLIAAGDAFDLLLVGTHGRTGIQRVWLGSVAERITRGATRPVLVFRVGLAESPPS